MVELAAKKVAIPLCLGVTALLLLVILLPTSFSYIDYWEYGLKQRKTTGAVDITKIYGKGRYLVGPDYKFLKYQADAHYVHLEDVGVFSDGGADSVGLSFLIDLDYTYFLKKDKIGEIHKQYAKTYKNVILSRTNDALKNSASGVPFSDYFNDRVGLELRLKAAVQARWDQEPSVYATLDQFHLGRILIPDVVADKQLSAKIQIETNRKEEFLQNATVEREITAVLVDSINLEKNKLLREITARASLLTANAFANATEIRNNAINEGTKSLLADLGIDSQEYSTAFTYLRTLQNHPNIGSMRVSYLADDNLVKTVEQP